MPDEAPEKTAWNVLESMGVQLSADRRRLLERMERQRWFNALSEFFKLWILISDEDCNGALRAFVDRVEAGLPNGVRFDLDVRRTDVAAVQVILIETEGGILFATVDPGNGNAITQMFAYKMH